MAHMFDNNMRSADRRPSVNSIRSTQSTPTLKRKESTLSNAVEGENTLGLEVFKRQSSADYTSNLVLSPKSYCTALHVVGLGAWGKTKAQIEEAMGGVPLGVHLFSKPRPSKTGSPKSQRHHLRKSITKKAEKWFKRIASTDSNQSDQTDSAIPHSGEEREKTPYHIVNKICVRKGLKIDEGFSSQALASFGAKTKMMDFAAHPDKSREHINEWVKKHTNGRIPQAVSENDVTAGTSMVIVNCIYFKGEWEDKFDPMHTMKRNFHCADGTDKQTDFMFRKDDILFHANADLNCRAVELPYTGHELSFVVILPDAADGLLQLEQKLTIDNYSDIFTDFKKQKDVLLYLPKFKMESQMELVDSLKESGIQDLFSEKDADLRGIETKGLLYVSALAHKVFIEVNEEGSEAAACTVETLRSAGGSKIQPTVFDAKHPFLFLIKENSTNSIVFFGKYTRPV